MANGDTKTEAMLNVLGNGGSGDEFRGCCNTKTQQYILDAIDRINNLDPGGGGSGFTLLSDADANWTDPDSGDEMIALWLLPTGTYRFSPDATVMAALGLDTDGESTWVNTTIEKASEPIFIISNEDIGQSMASITILASNASQSANVDNAIGLIDFTDSGPFLPTDFIGTDGTNKGTKGLVPAPEATDADKFLKSDGTWDTAGGSSVNVVQTRGTSTTDVMSQNAVTSMVYADPTTRYNVRIGEFASGNPANGGAVIIGSADTGSTNGISIGEGSVAFGTGSIALGSGSKTNVAGEMNIGTKWTSNGYNNSLYRLISGVYDGQNAHDAVTVGQVNSVIDSINSALNTNIPHIGA